MKHAVLFFVFVAFVLPLASRSAAAQTANTAATNEQGASAQAPSEQAQQARARFQNGELLFENENFDGALAEYQTVYDLLEGHPRRYNVLFNIGLCNERLFRYDLAIRYYQRYLDEGGAEADDRVTVEASIRTLNGLLGTVVVESNVPASVWTGDRELGAAPGEVMLPAGTHALTIRADGFDTALVEVQVAPRERQTIDVELEEVFDGISPAGFATTLSIALVAAGVGVYFALDARSIRNDAEARPVGDPVVELDRQAIRDAALKADIFFGVAGLFAVTSIILLPFTHFGGDDDEPSLSLSPAMGPGVFGVTLRGTL